MDMKVTHNDDATLVEFDHLRLDAAVAPQLKAALLKVVTDGANKVVLDLHTVKMIDSSGLGALVSVLKAMNGQGSITIRGASSSVMGLFKLTRMDRVFTLETVTA
jgi:anti-sigma B factor antagonist